MNGSIAGFGWAAGLAGSLFWAAPVFAATGGHLAYSAPEGCAPEAEFEASVAERGGHFDAYAAPEAGRELRVSIMRTAGGFLGTFQAVEADGASALREVHGATCQEVTAALVVVSAIALRGEDASKSDAAVSVEAASAPPAPAPRSSPAVVRAIKAAPTPVPTPEADAGHLRASSGIGGSKSVEVTAGKLRFDAARSITLFAGGEVGILPSKILPRYDLSINAASFVTTPAGTSFIAGVIPRIRLSYFGKSSYQAPESTSVSAQGLGFGLGLCWSPSYDTRGFVALFCAEYGVGVMQLTSVSSYVSGAPFFSTNTDATHSTSAALQTGGLSFEGEYHLGSFFHLGLKLGIDGLLQEITAERADGSQIFHSSTILGYGMLGLGFHF